MDTGEITKLECMQNTTVHNLIPSNPVTVRYIYQTNPTAKFSVDPIHTISLLWQILFWCKFVKYRSFSVKRRNLTHKKAFTS